MTIFLKEAPQVWNSPCSHNSNYDANLILSFHLHGGGGGGKLPYQPKSEVQIIWEQFSLGGGRRGGINSTTRKLCQQKYVWSNTICPLNILYLQIKYPSPYFMSSSERVKQTAFALILFITLNDK